MFEFQNKERNWDGNKRGSLMTPSKEDFKDGKFDIQTFLACYVNYYNSRKLRKANCRQLQVMSKSRR